MKALRSLAIMLCCVVPASSEPVRGSLPVQWNMGAQDCAAASEPPLQVHAYDAQTYILRQSLCASFEGDFIYLLVGSQKALLIDTGAIADAGKMPLAKTILSLLQDGVRLPLLVVHTHRHRDHYAGDVQFTSAPDVQIIAPDLASVRAFFGFDRWPEGVAHVDLGDRMIDVIPTPGHETAHVVFYDERTALLFSGDFLMPGRLTLEDTGADTRSAARVIDFLATRPVAHILGGHIERDVAGHTYAEGSTYHPNERPLELSREDLLALPSALASFNGFYASHENYSITHPMHNLLVLAVLAVAVLILIVWGVRRLLRRRRRRHG